MPKIFNCRRTPASSVALANGISSIPEGWLSEVGPAMRGCRSVEFCDIHEEGSLRFSLAFRVFLFVRESSEDISLLIESEVL
jgi:hypothetical protein